MEQQQRKSHVHCRVQQRDNNGLCERYPAEDRDEHGGENDIRDYHQPPQVGWKMVEQHDVENEAADYDPAHNHDELDHAEVSLVLGYEFEDDAEESGFYHKPEQYPDHRGWDSNVDGPRGEEEVKGAEPIELRRNRPARPCHHLHRVGVSPILPFCIMTAYPTMTALSCGLLLAAGPAVGKASASVEETEKRFRHERKLVMRVPYRIPDGTPGRSVLFGTDTLKATELYAKSPEGTEYLHIAADGRAIRNDRPAGRLRESGELLLTPEEWVLFIDGVPVPGNMKDWQFNWVAREQRRPLTRSVVYRIAETADSFMRTVLESDHCRITSGSWRLHQHGGGMPRSPEEVRNARFQRAVNPFTVRGSDHGRLTFGERRWIDYHAECRFYFGVPVAAQVTDTGALPTGTDMMIAQGDDGDNQVAFGWSGAERSFVLKLRRAGGDWELLRKWKEHRPPISNWIVLGVEVRAGHFVRALLDGAVLYEEDLGLRVGGRFHVMSGAEPIEVDDVRAWPLDRGEGNMVAFNRVSRNFAGKAERGDHDPRQFGEWARSMGVFTQSRRIGADGKCKAVIVTAFPLMGDVSYESIPYDDVAEHIPTGTYEFGIHPAGEEATLDPQTVKPVFSFTADLSPNGWRLHGLSPEIWPPGRREFMLRFHRFASYRNHLAVQLDEGWIPFSPAVPGPFHLSIAKVEDGYPYLPFPAPGHHSVRCRNLTNELFEEAPTEWSWVEGAFRMACRWACADRWNFMACGGTGIPYMTSKKTFSGRQIHEYFMSLRSVFPWDAGDESFVYDSAADRKNGFKRLAANNAWYSRRDLNFSFCTDGKNPFSGYSVVFGGDDNAESRLLRRGEVVARVVDPFFLFGTGESHHVVHWQWWKFTVRKSGTRIRVFMNDMPMFDYTDPEPLDGGHIGFWTVRNGFSLARVMSLAERVGRVPSVLYVRAGERHGSWVPLLRDSVAISKGKKEKTTRVVNNVGAGFFGVRFFPATPVDVREMPMMALPIELGPKTAVNLHLYMGKRSYIIQLNAPIGGMKSLLTPEFEKGECFRIPTMGVDDVRKQRLLAHVAPKHGVLRINLLQALKRLGAVPEQPALEAITIGNTSNKDYVLAGGIDANRAGAWYEVGEPEFSAE